MNSGSLIREKNNRSLSSKKSLFRTGLVFRWMRRHRRRAGGRFIAFYFDDLNSSDAELMQARDGADRYLAASLQPNDRVALFSSDKVLSDFTSDHDQIHQALMQLRAERRGTFPAALVSRPHRLSGDATSSATKILKAKPGKSRGRKARPARSKHLLLRRLPVQAVPTTASLLPSASSPRQLSTGIRTGHAQVCSKSTRLWSLLRRPRGSNRVLVSHGFFSQSEQQALDHIVDRALRAGVVINSLDPKGLDGHDARV